MHAAYVTRMEHAQIIVNFLLVHCSVKYTLKTLEKCFLHFSTVFKKIHACLYNSTVYLVTFVGQAV